MQELNKIFREKEKAKRFLYDEKRRVVYGQWIYLHPSMCPKWMAIHRKDDKGAPMGGGRQFPVSATFLYLLCDLTSSYQTLMDHCGLRQCRCQWCS